MVPLQPLLHSRLRSHSRRDFPVSKAVQYVDAVGFKDVSRLLPELHDMEVERQEHNLDELER